MLQLIIFAAASTHALVLPPLPRIDAPNLRDTHGFSAVANWLVPGVILCGANPCKGRGSALNRVKAICDDGGCSTFVSLQEEAEDDARGTDYEAAARAATDAPMFKRYPIHDLRPCDSLEYLEDITCELAARVRAGESIYLHCFAGRGRTGLVACCLLGELYPSLDVEEALQCVGAYYKTRALFDANSRAADGYSPVTEPQRDQVRDFFARRAVT